MATRDSWQFVNVSDFGAGTRVVPDMGSACPLTVSSAPAIAGDRLDSGFGVEYDSGVSGAEVSFGLPADLQGISLTGRVRILVSSSSFLRDPDLLSVGQDNFNGLEINLDPAIRDIVSYKHYISAPKGSTAYVSACYEDVNGVWCFSQDNLMDRSLVKGVSGEYGEILFKLLPPAFRQVDQDNGDSAAKLMRIFGTAFEDVSVEIDALAKSQDVLSIDAGRLAFIDRLVGWPTNLLLGSDIRRNETYESVSIFKRKSTSSAIDYAVQQTIGWSAKVYEGWVWSFGTNAFDPLQPVDWIEGEPDPNSTDDPANQNSGIWADIQTPSIRLWSPQDGVSSGSFRSGPSVLPDFSDWKKPSGVLVVLTPLPTRRTPINQIAIDRARKLSLELSPHYADVFIQIADFFSENINLQFSDESDDDIFATSDNSISIEFSISHASYVGYCAFSTFPAGGDLNSSNDRLIHTALRYTCA